MFLNFFVSDLLLLLRLSYFQFTQTFLGKNKSKVQIGYIFFGFMNLKVVISMWNIIFC